MFRFASVGDLGPSFRSAHAQRPLARRTRNARLNLRDHVRWLGCAFLILIASSGFAKTDDGRPVSNAIDSRILNSIPDLPGRIVPGGAAASLPVALAPDKLFGVPKGCNGRIYAITAAPAGEVYLGGDFNNCEEVVAANIVAYDPVNRSFRALGAGPQPGTNGTVLALHLVGQQLYVGGTFTTAGGVTVNRIARWDGSVWSALGEGVAGSDVQVRAITSIGTDVFVGGNFTSAGAQAANRIARWNGSSWSALGPGPDRLVHALTVSAGTLYAGGEFWRV